MKFQNNKSNFAGGSSTQLEMVGRRGVFWVKSQVFRKRSAAKEPNEGSHRGTIASPLLSIMMSGYYIAPAALQILLLAEGSSVLQISFRQAFTRSWRLAMEQMSYMRMRQWVSWTAVPLGHSVAHPTRDFFAEKFQPGPSFFFSTEIKLSVEGQHFCRG